MDDVMKSQIDEGEENDTVVDLPPKQEKKKIDVKRLTTAGKIKQKKMAL
jgi:hypothetical protein